MEVVVNITGFSGQDWPSSRILLNDQELFTGQIQGNKRIAAKIPVGRNKLLIQHYNKNNDTRLDANGNIISDRHIILDSIEINGLIFDLNYFSEHRIPFKTDTGDDLITNYFGQDGVFTFEFEYPLWRWWNSLN